MTINDLTPREKITRARMQLQKDNPFFSYLVMNLKIQEEQGKTNSCAVDNKGNLYYNDEFILSLNDNELKTLLCHEIMHVALLHLVRIENRKPLLWNVAIDIIVNNLLVLNNFQFSGALLQGLVPQNNTFEKGEIKIENLDKKYSEEVYNILLSQLKEEKQNKGKLEDGEELLDLKGFDEHIHGKEITEQEAESIRKDWNGKMQEAVEFAKQQGKTPSGLGRYISEILNAKMNWKQLLYKFITQEIPSDWSYSMPHKRSHATGIYFPKTTKEKIEVFVAIDVSGSIGNKELAVFLGEVLSLSNSFENVQINLITWDTQLNEEYILGRCSVDDVINLKISGGGGTDFSNVYEKVREISNNPKLLIFFTDGYATFPREEEIKTLWILTENSVEENKMPFGDVVKMTGVENGL